MTQRHLTITMKSDWQGALRAATASTGSARYQGEILNFESPGQFFGQLTEKRWALVRACQGAGEVSVRELARRLGRDVKRVLDDIVTLTELGMLERTEQGGVMCPFASVHIDMVLEAA